MCFELLPHGQIFHLGESRATDGRAFPLIALSFGSQDPQAPTLLLNGGAHGLERIGSQVVLAFLTSFGEMILWDRLLREALKNIRIIFLPILNPLGVLDRRRANPNGVDLMRNSPLDSHEAAFLLGGHRISPRLPWYRGESAERLEPETQALLNLMESHMLEAPRLITMDFHSGFGVKDQIWFPWAGKKEPFPNLAEMYALKEAFERTHPHHVYRIEPQSLNYLTQGDIWDHFYIKHRTLHEGRGVYLPLTMEMGSWAWVKKNPLQLMSVLGPYNPMKPHRLKRILRRHNTIFDFMVRAMVSPEVWIPAIDEQRQKYHDRAISEWYSQLEKGNAK
ncbi:MAG: DUF2817 domain-containing protein [Bdellovibrionaceae bacterium]|nr:DUF2817 domain-containing protein [Pseudobdellovibrionaceae bacterium]